MSSVPLAHQGAVVFPMRQSGHNGRRPGRSISSAETATACGVVRDESGKNGGIFIDRDQAVKFAMFENGRHPDAVIMTPGILELDLK
jgi:hypothetical protein